MGKEISQKHLQGIHVHAPSSEPAMGQGILRAIGNYGSHQELARIVDEIESIYGVQPIEGVWLPLSVLAPILCSHLGYEDEDELEDALQMPLSAFLVTLPHIDTGEKKEEGQSEDDIGEFMWRVQSDPPVSEWVPRKITFNIRERRDLWRLFLKSKTSTVVIPLLEFEIGPENKRNIDTVYNHISKAIFNIESYAHSLHDGNENKEKMLETTSALRSLLDVDEPFSFVVEDPSGLSEFEPPDGVVVEPLYDAEDSSHN